MSYELLKKFTSFVNQYGNMIDITIIVHFIIYIVVLYLFPSKHLFINMMTIDGAISSIRFIKTLHESDINDIIKNYSLNGTFENDLMMRKLKQLLDTKYKRFAKYFDFTNDGKINTFQKYFVWLIFQGISFILCTLLWDYGAFLINGLLLIFAMPFFYTLILNNIYFLKIFTLVVTKAKHILAFVLSKLTASVINKLAQICFNSNPKIDHNELIDYFEDYTDTITKIWTFLKTTFILTGIHYIKKTNNILYYYIIDIIHKYHINNLLLFPKTDLPMDKKQKLLSDIIKGRRWKEFLDSKTVNILFELYESKNNDVFSTKIGMFIRNVIVNFLRFVSLWSSCVISPTAGLLVDIYYTWFNNKFGISHHNISYIIGALVMYSGNAFLGSLLLVCSDILIKPILDYIEEHQIISKYIIKSKEELLYLVMVIIMAKFKYATLLLPLITYYIDSNKFMNFGTFFILALGYVSDFSVFHVTFAWLILNIIYNVKTDKPDINKPLGLHIIDNNFSVTSKPNVKPVQIEMIKINNTDSNKSQDVEEPERQNMCKRITSWVGY